MLFCAIKVGLISFVLSNLIYTHSNETRIMKIVCIVFEFKVVEIK